MRENLVRNMLVTGGAGFIGANFVRYWLNKHPNDKIIVLDALTYASQLNNLDYLQHFSNYFFIHGNILNQPLIEDILKTHQINTIVHFAAESHVDRSIVHPENFIYTNIVGTYSLL